MKNANFPRRVGARTALAALFAAAALPAVAANESRALEAGHEYLMIANYPNNLHVLDLATNSVYKTCALPDAFGPGITQISPDRRTAFILNNRFGTIYGVDLDSCNVRFRAEMSQAPNERAKAIGAIALSPDGKELYTVQNPTTIERDRYHVGEPRFAVYDTSAGLDAKPVRTFAAPRQVSLMQAGDDGALYMFGADLYKVDVRSGKMDVALPIRSWQRKDYSPIDLLYLWPVQTPTKDFTVLYTTAKYQDEKQDLATAEYQYGYMNVNLATGKTEAREFGPLTEIYFTGMRSPKDRNIIYGLLHRLTKYDISQQKLLQAAELEHTYYTVLTNGAGSKLYLTGTFNDVAVYDADSLTRVAKIQLPGGDMSLGTGQVFIR